MNRTHRLLLATGAALAFAACASSTQTTQTDGDPTPAPAPAAATRACVADDSDPGQVVAEVGSEKLTIGQLDALAADSLKRATMDHRRKVHEVRSEALQRYIDDRLLAAEAKKRGLESKDALIEAEVAKKVAEPTEEEVKAFYDANVDRMQGAPFDLIAPRIKTFLQEQARAERFDALIEGLRKDAGVKVSLPEVRIEVAAEGPALGPKDAPVTIVEFSDFQCPFCARGTATVKQVLAHYGDKVRLVFRDFPLSFHDQAQKAAEAARCAGKQGKFWPMHDKLFGNQQALSPDQLVEHAKDLEGVDAAAFEKCLTSGEMAAAVKADMAAGEAAGVSGTPAFFVNGVMLSGALPFEEFKAVIDRELARQSSK